MWTKASAIILASLLAVQPAKAQLPQPGFHIVAQAYDHCMATFAVRLTRTTATDEEIFMQAARSCMALKGRLISALREQLPPADATAILRTIDANAEPSFMSMLDRIRSGRAKREGG